MKHNELAAIMGRVCHGEKTADVISAALVFLANVISKNCDDKDDTIDNFAENLKAVVAELDKGHGYKINVEMQ